MNLIIDIGNTNAKLCVFDGDAIVYKESVASESGNVEQSVRDLARRYPVSACIECSVGKEVPGIATWLAEIGARHIRLTHDTPVPVANRYGTPHTLGMDRLAAAVGASVVYPGCDVLVIDAGTAITYDYLRGGVEFAGGNIAPGIRLRLKSLHDYTSRLPLVEPSMPGGDFALSTSDAVNNGVVMGVAREMEGYIADFKQKKVKAEIILTGGDSIFLSKLLKFAIFAEPNLVLIGLNRILNYNVSKND